MSSWGLGSSELSMILAESNEAAWENYLSCTGDYADPDAVTQTEITACSRGRQLHARFYLCRVCGINSTYTYCYEDEEVQFNDPTSANVEVFGTVGGGKWWYRDTDGNIVEYLDTETAEKYAYLYTGFSQWNNKAEPINYPGGWLEGQFWCD